MAFLDGEADQEIELHLQKCEYCRNRTKTLAREQNKLTSRLYRVLCPTTEELGEFQLRMLSAPQMLVVAQHVRECPHCKREINQLEEFLSDLAPASGSSLQARTKVLVARLISGLGGATGAGKPSFALRGEEKGPITFEAEGVFIVLDIQPANEEKVNILGQVAADNQDLWTGSTVTLTQADGSKTTDSLDDLGAFHFEQVSLGSIQIMILSPQGVEVQIPSIDV